jgi:Ca2+-binding RTX toxin-like protein
LGASQWQAMTSEDLVSLNGSQWLSLSTEALVALSTSQWRSMAVDDLAALQGSQWSFIATDDLNALSAAQWNSLASNDLNALTAAQWQSLGTEILNAMGPSQWQSISSQSLGWLTTTQWAAITTEDLRSLTTSQWAQLQIEDLQSLGSAQWQSLSAEALQALSGTQWAAMTSDDLASLLALQWQSMTTSDLNALTSSQWSSLPSDALNAITNTQWARIASDDLRSLSSAQWQAMATDDLDSLNIGYLYTASASGGFVYGGGGADCLTGSLGADRLEARGGDDRLVLSAGDDCMSGGAGIDTLVIEQGPSGVLLNASGLGTNPASAAFGIGTTMISIDLGNITQAQSISSTSSLRLLDSSIEVIDASAQQHANVDLALVGNNAANTLIGGFGDDYVRAMTTASNTDANANVLAGGLGADYLRSGDGADTLYGGLISNLVESADTIGGGDNVFFADLFAPFSTPARSGPVFDNANIYEARGGDDVLVASSQKDIFFYQTWNAQGSDSIYNFRVGQDYVFAVSQNSYPNGTDRVWFGDTVGAAFDIVGAQDAYRAGDTLPGSALLAYAGQNYAPGSIPVWSFQDLGGGTYLLKFDANGDGTPEFTITLIGVAGSVTDVNQLFPPGG